MSPEIIHADLPSRQFEPRIYGVGAWTGHLHFGYDLVAILQPRLLVELGVDRGESYFAFCQAAAEVGTGTRCVGIDTWEGDPHAGGYDETTLAEVAAHNRANYETFSTLLRSSFDAALEKFPAESIDVLHLDGLHTESAVRHDLQSWLPKLRPGGILLLHDVAVRKADFAVWKVWDELREAGRSWMFDDGPGLGVWQKPPALQLPRVFELLFGRPGKETTSVSGYYRARADELHERMAQEWLDGTIRDTPSASQTVIQVFYTSDRIHRPEASISTRIGHDKWQNVSLQLPPNQGAAPLRVDFVSALTTIEIASLSLTIAGRVCFHAGDAAGFDAVTLAGDVRRVPDPKLLRLEITSLDPQLYLPPQEGIFDHDSFLRMSLRVQRGNHPLK